MKAEYATTTFNWKNEFGGENGAFSQSYKLDNWKAWQIKTQKEMKFIWKLKYECLGMLFFEHTLLSFTLRQTKLNGKDAFKK